MMRGALRTVAHAHVSKVGSHAGAHLLLSVPTPAAKAAPAAVPAALRGAALALAFPLVHVTACGCSRSGSTAAAVAAAAGHPLGVAFDAAHLSDCGFTRVLALPLGWPRCAASVLPLDACLTALRLCDIMLVRDSLAAALFGGVNHHLLELACGCLHRVLLLLLRWRSCTKCNPNKGLVGSAHSTQALLALTP